MSNRSSLQCVEAFLQCAEAALPTFSSIKVCHSPLSLIHFHRVLLFPLAHLSNYLSLFLVLASQMDSSPFSKFVDLLNSQQTISFVNLEETVSQASSQAVGNEDGGETGTRAKTRRKWTTADDIVLISAWLNTSKDAVVSNEQKSSTFWSRVAAYYSASRQDGEGERGVLHCKQRWHKINDLVCKFCGAYAAATREKTYTYGHEEAFEDNEDGFDEAFDQYFDQRFDQAFENVCSTYGHQGTQKKTRKKREFIERNREEGHQRLWNDYFSDTPTYPQHLFRRRFRMNRPLFMRIVDRLSNEVQFFRQKQDVTGRNGLSPLQKCTAAIRVLAYGSALDAVDEYLRLGATTARLCVENFVEAIIDLFGVEYLRRPTPDDLQRLLNIGELRGFPGMVGSIDCTLNDINVLDRSPVFDDIINGHAPEVNFSVNGNSYSMAYYLTDGIYPKWATFIQSISLPQGPKAALFAQCQEAVRKDVERAFGVLQARFAIVKNPALCWDKVKIGKIMRACIILHNMIVENERDQQSQFDVSGFQQGEGNTSSHVDLTYSADTPTNIANQMGVRVRIRDKQAHQQLKRDLVEHIWRKFGRDQDNN
ncbi:uncharacterized protein LOC117127523 [Brassica rapa]|uniref:uncharacterized protein LOC117127523 n=1 Tax=Brassica campestris TaxID=3711 RepID=UPI00142E1BEA|nr:uncharacterized protein LOC117127523 [Brassica rapa]